MYDEVWKAFLYEKLTKLENKHFFLLCWKNSGQLVDDDHITLHRYCKKKNSLNRLVYVTREVAITEGKIWFFTQTKSSSNKKININIWSKSIFSVYLPVTNLDHLWFCRGYRTLLQSSWCQSASKPHSKLPSFCLSLLLFFLFLLFIFLYSNFTVVDWKILQHKFI